MLKIFFKSNSWSPFTSSLPVGQTLDLRRVPPHFIHFICGAICNQRVNQKFKFAKRGQLITFTAEIKIRIQKSHTSIYHDLTRLACRIRKPNNISMQILTAVVSKVNRAVSVLTHAEMSFNNLQIFTLNRFSTINPQLPMAAL